jgi:NADPH-dependent glutamate synthase beta subunit-like oxidoreductase/NAD(P)H-flavin reductase
MSTLELAFGFAFPDLYRREGLARIDAHFIKTLAAAAPELAERLKAARADPGNLEPVDESRLLLDLAPHLDAFLGELFGIAEEMRALAERHRGDARLLACKRRFVQRRAAKKLRPEEAATIDGPGLEQEIAAQGSLSLPLDDRAFAECVMGWLNDEAEYATQIDLATRYAAWALHTGEGRERWCDSILFRRPEKTDPLRLLPLETREKDGTATLGYAKERWRWRDGFGLTDQGFGLTPVLDQANYCIFCHNQGKDSCSRGLRDRQTGDFARSKLGNSLWGCPLEEKISEMNRAKADGLSIAALACAVVDNPMLAGTGHRICNDCMKSCIYQKQEPVDIPQIETRTLKDVLELPWGFEIYSLLSRWNPLNLRRPLPVEASGYKVLVVGQGPAGFTLAHHLLNQGHTVVAIDGLKIEPLPKALCGVDTNGKRVAFGPVRDVETLFETLGERVLAGFGGVAEYGITVRWNKNFLKLIRLLLERREGYRLFGGVRFGGAITVDSAFAMGFDHIALAVGAGKPTFIAMPNGLARGIRQASDFLMALQLTGAAKTDSIANLQIRLPVVVVGGGLTAIDTATEALAYYPLQVEKFLSRYETLVAEKGEAAVRQGWNEEETAIAEEYLAHARTLRTDRQRAAAEGRAPRLLERLNEWGGATIVYRRRLVDAPCYRLNHEEVGKAFEEGVRFAEFLAPISVDLDQYRHVKQLHLARKELNEDGHLVDTGETESLAARTVLIAAGTQPNTVLGREDPANIKLDGHYFQAVNEVGDPVAPEHSAKPAVPQVLLSLRDDGRAISFFGDLHPSFAGNVVKAMASAKQGHPVIDRVIHRRRPTLADGEGFLEHLNEGLRAVVHEVRELVPGIIEVVVRAPLAAAAFRPGQFYRLQNFEARALRNDGTALAMEGLAMTGAWVDREKGLVAVIVLEMGGSSDLCAALAPGEPVILMGPTGTPTEIVGGKTVLLAGGGLGNAVLFSIGEAFREAGSRVLYFAGYRRAADRYYAERIERAADSVVWCSDDSPGLTPERPQDRAFVGNIVEAMLAYAEGELGEPGIPLSEVDRVLAIGSDAMMAAVARARHGVLKAHLNPDHVAIGSINSPMQCMMKEICAQCLQPHRNPETGHEEAVFSCFNQDQPLDYVDFGALAERLRQNSLQEKLTRAWVDRGLIRLQVRNKAG